MALGGNEEVDLSKTLTRAQWSLLFRLVNSVTVLVILGPSKCSLWSRKHWWISFSSCWYLDKEKKRMRKHLFHRRMKFQGQPPIATFNTESQVCFLLRWSTWTWTWTTLFCDAGGGSHQGLGKCKVAKETKDEFDWQKKKPKEAAPYFYLPIQHRKQTEVNKKI